MKMKLSSYFLMLFLIEVSICKSHQKYKHDSESIEGDTLIDKILSSDRFHELSDKIVEKAVEKINNQQSAATILASNDPGIETKKSNVNPNLEFKSIHDSEKKDSKPEKKSKKSQKRFTYKPGKIVIQAVMQKKIIPSDHLTFRYDRFTRNDRAISASDKPPAEEQNTEKANTNVVNEDKESTSKHKIIKKPSADGDSEEQNKSATDEESNSEGNNHAEKTSPNDSVESTKLIVSDTKQVTKSQNENPFGNEKVITWNGKHNDDDNTDSENKSSDEDKQNAEQTSPKVTKEINIETEATNIPHLFRAETVSTTTPKDDNVNEVDDNGDYQDDDLEDIKLEQRENKNKTKNVIRREGDRTYVLKDSSDYQEYHEQLAKIRKSQR